MNKLTQYTISLLIGCAAIYCAFITYKTTHTNQTLSQQVNNALSADIAMEGVTFTLQTKPPLSIEVHAATTTFDARQNLLTSTSLLCTVKKGHQIIGYVQAPTGTLFVTEKKIQFPEMVTILDEDKKFVATGADAWFFMQSSTITFNNTLVANYDLYSCTAERGSCDLINKKIKLEGSVTTCIK